MNYYEWKNIRQSRITLDRRELPIGKSLPEHMKYCKAHKHKCPYLPPIGEMQNGLLEEFMKNGVSEKLRGDANSILRYIVAGKGRHLRLPSQIFMDKRTLSLPRWMLLAYIVASPAKDVLIQEKILVDFAIHDKSYYEDIDSFFENHFGDCPKKHGMEAVVYDTGTGVVVKDSSLDAGTYGPLQKIERIMLGNICFPETAYMPFAIGKSKTRGLRFAISQKKVHEDEKHLTNEEIKEWMKNRGWNEIGECAYASFDKVLECVDMHERNVIRTKEGDIVCIDHSVVPYHYNYDSPPKSIPILSTYRLTSQE